MTSNFIDQFGFNEEEFTEQEESAEWVQLYLINPYSPKVSICLTLNPYLADHD